MSRRNMMWSRKHRMWVDRDDRTPQEKARHERIARELDRDTDRIQGKLEGAYKENQMASKKARKSDPEKAFNQAWEIKLEESKPARVLWCPTCGRKTVYKMDPKTEKTPFCVKCLDKALLKLGLKRMVDKGPAPGVKDLVMSWAPSTVEVGKVVTKKARK